MDGIKIRELDNTTTVADDDVLLIDSVNTQDSGLSYTKNIKYTDFLRELEADLDIPEPPDDDDATSGDFYMLKQGPTITIKVTVGTKSDFSRFYNRGSQQCYFLDGKEAPVILLTPGRRYRFDTTEVPAPFEFIFASSITAFFGSISTGVTTGEGFIMYEAVDDYTRLYYADRQRSTYMGNAMINLDGSQEWSPGRTLDLQQQIDELKIKVDELSGGN